LTTESAFGSVASIPKALSVGIPVLCGARKSQMRRTAKVKNRPSEQTGSKKKSAAE